MNSYQKKTAETAARRRAKMNRLRHKGWTLERIGNKFGISRQRVSVLLKQVVPQG